jgi:hypothetical protein
LRQGEYFSGEHEILINKTRKEGYTIVVSVRRSESEKTCYWTLVKTGTLLLMLNACYNPFACSNIVMPHHASLVAAAVLCGCLFISAAAFRFGSREDGATPFVHVYVCV